MEINHFAVLGKRRIGSQGGYKGRAEIVKGLDLGETSNRMAMESFRIE